MADNVITMKKRRENPQEHIEKSLKKNKGLILGIVGAVVAVAVVVCVVVTVGDKSKNKNLAVVSQIEQNYVKGANQLTSDEVATRKAETLESLEKYTKKSGIVGVRANLLAADIYFSNEDYENARVCYEKAGNLKKGAYTASVAFMNAGTCGDMTNDFEGAAKLYEKSSKVKESLLVTRALFNQGKSLELAGNTEKAVEVFTKLVDTYPEDEWAKLAQSKLISLSAN